jgi:hypothetical protein
MWPPFTVSTSAVPVFYTLPANAVSTTVRATFFTVPDWWGLRLVPCGPRDFHGTQPVAWVQIVTSAGTPKILNLSTAYRADCLRCGRP